MDQPAPGPFAGSTKSGADGVRQDEQPARNGAASSPLSKVRREKSAGGDMSPPWAMPRAFQPGESASPPPPFRTKNLLYGPIAQWLEQGTHNSLVPGSNPGGPTNFLTQAGRDL